MKRILPCEKQKGRDCHEAISTYEKPVHSLWADRARDLTARSPHFALPIIEARDRFAKAARITERVEPRSLRESRSPRYARDEGIKVEHLEGGPSITLLPRLIRSRLNLIKLFIV